MLNFKGQNVVITGGSRGLGRAMAEKFAALGANVAIVSYRDDENAGNTVAALRAMGVKAECYACDVSDFAAAGQTAAQIEEEFGPVAVLVNNAGIVRDALILNMSEADFDAVISTNLKGAFNFTKHFYRPFMRRRSGRIINTASVIGLGGNAGQANYAAAKAGLIGLTKSTAKELAARGITCNAIAPGFIDSAMTAALSDKVKEDILADIPARRMGTPEEVANLVVFLASDMAAYITGEVIRIDGGLNM